jgi:rubrerythrin
MLAMAIEKEQKGREFYKKAADTASNELGRQMFRSLMADEGIHIKRCKEIFDTLKAGKTWTGDWRSHSVENENLDKLIRDRITELGSKISAQTGDIEALEIGIDMEQGAIKFYEEELAKASDSFEKDFLSKMLIEERSHFKALNDLKLFFTDPQSYYMETERPVHEG